MRAIIGNQVKTEYSDHVFHTREEAEAFYFAMRDREAHREDDTQTEREYRITPPRSER